MYYVDIKRLIVEQDIAAAREGLYLIRDIVRFKKCLRRIVMRKVFELLTSCKK